MKNENIGIHKVLANFNRLTQLKEDARFNLSNMNEDDGEEFNFDDETGGENLDQPDETNPDTDTGLTPDPDINPMGDDEEIDLDALGDSGFDALDSEPPVGNEPMGQPESQLTQPVGETPPDTGMDTSGGADEEIDVTDFVEKSTDLTQKVDSQVQALTTQIDTLTKKLQSMDGMIDKIQQVEDEMHAMKPPKPIETLRLRSLDSYPYNQGIDDYWKKKEMEIDKLRDFNRVDNQEFVLTNDDIANFSDISVRDSLAPGLTQQNQFDRHQSDEPKMGRFTNQS